MVSDKIISYHIYHIPRPPKIPKTTTQHELSKHGKQHIFLHCSWPIQPNPSHLRTGPVTRPRPTSARPRWGPAPWPPASARPTKRPGSWLWGRRRRPRCSPGVAGRPGGQPWQPWFPWRFFGFLMVFWGGFLKGIEGISWGHLAKFKGWRALRIYEGSRHQHEARHVSACQGCHTMPKKATEMVLATMPKRIRARSPIDFWSLGTTKSKEKEAFSGGSLVEKSEKKVARWYGSGNLSHFPKPSPWF